MASARIARSARRSAQTSRGPVSRPGIWVTSSPSSAQPVESAWAPRSPDAPCARARSGRARSSHSSRPSRASRSPRSGGRRASARYTWRMRVVVLGAGGAHKTEASIVRAARALGHACRLVNVVGWSRYARPVRRPRASATLTEAFEPDFVLLTRHAILAGEPDAPCRCLRGRERAFWYFDLAAEAAGARAGPPGRTHVRHVPARRSSATARPGIREVVFLPQGVDPERRPARAIRVPPRSCCDASFVGSGQYPAPLRRAARRWPAACRLQIRGPGWDAGARDLPVAGGPVRGRRLAPGHPRRRHLPRRERASRAGRRTRLRVQPHVEDPGLRRVLPRPLRAGHRGVRRRRRALRLVPLAGEAAELARALPGAPDERAPDRGGGAGARARRTTPTPSVSSCCCRAGHTSWGMRPQTSV